MGLKVRLVKSCARFETCSGHGRDEAPASARAVEERSDTKGAARSRGACMEGRECVLWLQPGPHFCLTAAHCLEGHWTSETTAARQAHRQCDGAYKLKIKITDGGVLAASRSLKSARAHAMRRNTCFLKALQRLQESQSWPIHGDELRSAINQRQPALARGHGQKPLKPLP
jgi:hypothetical protein